MSCLVDTGRRGNHSCAGQWRASGAAPSLSQGLCAFTNVGCGDVGMLICTFHALCEMHLMLLCAGAASCDLRDLAANPVRFGALLRTLAMRQTLPL